MQYRGEKLSPLVPQQRGCSGRIRAVRQGNALRASLRVLLASVSTGRSHGLPVIGNFICDQRLRKHCREFCKVITAPPLRAM